MCTAFVLFSSLFLLSCESEQVSVNVDSSPTQEEPEVTSKSTGDLDMLSYCAVIPGATDPTTRTPEQDGICRQQKGPQRIVVVFPIDPTALVWDQGNSDELDWQ